MNGSNDEMLRAAAEQFGDKTVDEIMFGELQIQCDQMARLFFQYTTMKFCPKAYKNSQSGFTLCQTLKKNFQMLPKSSELAKFLQIWPHWLQFKLNILPIANVF